MKSVFTKSALVLAMGLVAGASFAADSTPVSREQVRAAYLQARADGSLPATGEAQLSTLKPATISLSRDAVRADYRAARLSGTVAPTGEAQEIVAKAAPSAVTRDAVKAEYFAARKAGTLSRTGEAS